MHLQDQWRSKVDGLQACGFQHCRGTANDGDCLLTEIAKMGCILSECELTTAANAADR